MNNIKRILKYLRIVSQPRSKPISKHRSKLINHVYSKHHEELNLAFKDCHAIFAENVGKNKYNIQVV